LSENENLNEDLNFIKECNELPAIVSFKWNVPYLLKKECNI
jgi:hypothetical protein